MSSISKVEIGKRLSYLALLSLSREDDDELSVALEPIVNIHLKIQGDVHLRSKEFETDLEEIARVKGKEELSEEDFFEYASRTDWFEDYVSQYQVQDQALCQSIMIVVSNQIRSVAKAALWPLRKWANYRKWSERDLFALGERVGTVPWAEGIYVAGNYVRHFDEWRIFPYEEVVIDGKREMARVMSKPILDYIPTTREGNMMRDNVTIIEMLGVSLEDMLVSHTDQSRRLVRSLGLEDIASTRTRYVSWKEQLDSLVRAEVIK